MRAVHGGDFPAMFGKPQSVAARAAGEVECFARRQRRCGFHEKRRGRRLEIRRRVFTQTVALVPLVNFHDWIVPVAGNDCKAECEHVVRQLRQERVCSRARRASPGVAWTCNHICYNFWLGKPLPAARRAAR